MDRITLITGANRGIGFEIGKQLLAKEWTVIFTARNMAIGRPMVNELREQYKNAWFVQLNVTEEESINYAVEYVLKQHGRIDVLINNAGIFLDEGKSSSDVKVSELRETMETNVYGPLRVTRAFLPALQMSDDPRVLNLSSELGQLSTMGTGSPAYRISKTALNALTVIQANELAAEGIKVNSIHPGWVKTDMGGPNAIKSLEEGADTAVWLATEPDIPSGKYFRERMEMDW